MTTCTDNPRLGLIGCGATYSGRQQHCVARVGWSEHPDGRAHETFSTEGNVDRCWRGDDMRHPAESGLVRNVRGHWAEPGNDWQLYCRFGPSAVTGCEWGECFAVSFMPEHRTEMHTVLTDLARRHHLGRLDRCGGWELYRAWRGAPLPLDCHGDYGAVTVIDDATDDIDTIDDYHRLLEAWQCEP